MYREPVLEIGHINLMTETEVREQFEEAGVTVLEHYEFGFYLSLIAELSGGLGLRAAQWLEKKIRRGALSWMLALDAVVRRGKELAFARCTPSGRSARR